MSLYDDVVAGGRSSIRGDARVLEAFFAGLPSAHVFEISNVARYVLMDNTQEVWQREDFPEVRPPFDQSFFEYRTPPFFNNRGKLVPVPECRIGDLVIATDEVVNVIRVLKVERETVIVPAVFAVRYDTPGAGQIITYERTSEVLAGFGQMAATFFAISLCHCRNVVQVENAPSPALNKKRVQRGKAPLVTVRTLEIGAITRQLTEARTSSGGSLSKALHICRGHFKTYDERPLFGKLKGRFWWPAHARGEAEQGEVKKSYSVIPPSSEPSPPDVATTVQDSDDDEG